MSYADSTAPNDSIIDATDHDIGKGGLIRRGFSQDVAHIGPTLPMAC